MTAATSKSSPSKTNPRGTSVPNETIGDFNVVYNKYISNIDFGVDANNHKFTWVMDDLFPNPNDQRSVGLQARDHTYVVVHGPVQRVDDPVMGTLPYVPDMDGGLSTEPFRSMDDLEVWVGHVIGWAAEPDNLSALDHGYMAVAMTTRPTFKPVATVVAMRNGLLVPAGWTPDAVVTTTEVSVRDWLGSGARSPYVWYERIDWFHPTSRTAAGVVAEKMAKKQTNADKPEPEAPVKATSKADKLKALKRGNNKPEPTITTAPAVGSKGKNLAAARAAKKAGK